MSIKFLNLTAKNFLSIGNQTQALNFGEEQLTLVLGENLDQGGEDAGARNGVGKSSIINALSFALYGQALTNIKKDNLINNINNKHMLVTLTFEKDGTNYRIERGRKPAVLKFFINNAEQVTTDDEAQGDMRETQKELTQLLGMSHDMFKHVVALNTYTEPFLSMRANDQRVIIEQLLGITLLSEKADILKEQIKTTADAIFQETANIEAIKKSNDKIQQSISTLETRKKAWNSQKRTDCEKLTGMISELQGLDIDSELEKHASFKIYQEQTAKIESLTNEKLTVNTALSHASRALTKAANEIEKLKECACPACEQPLRTDKHQEMNAAASQQFHSQEEVVAALSAHKDEIENEISLLVSTTPTKPILFYDTVEDALRHQNNLASYTATLEKRSVEVDPYQEQIDELKTKAIQEISWTTVNELTSLKDHQQFLLKLLTNKDSFIRKKIIDQNLMYLNHRLTYYLDKLGLPHLVKFENDLTIKISQLGQDLDFDNLSRGERNRLIISLSFAFRDVWESLYQPINLLFIDELIDNGLDQAGVENAIALLKKLGRERNKNIYLISHRDELISRVNNVLHVVKEGGFTSFSAIDAHEVTEETND
jgi:DNA repair exonuclease SbcCD ATPase subunit